MKKPFNLETRTFLFAKLVGLYVKQLKPDQINTVYVNQLIRASSSIGANYIEANESLGKRDFLMHLKISRKEAKESEYWLKLLKEMNDNLLNCDDLIQEAKELKFIFTRIIEKSK